MTLLACGEVALCGVGTESRSACRVILVLEIRGVSRETVDSEKVVYWRVPVFFTKSVKGKRAHEPKVSSHDRNHSIDLTYCLFVPLVRAEKKSPFNFIPSPFNFILTESS